MNDSSNSYSISNRNHNIQTTDRLLSIYSLLLILIGTPCNLLCCIIYLKKSNRSNSIKIVFGFLAFLDTVALYTFNLNYVFREFNVDVKITYFNNSKNINNNGSPYFYESDNINTAIIKRNLEEYSLFICRFLSYLVIPSIVLFIFNALLMRIIFASKKRLDKHRRLVLFAATATTALPMTRQRQFLAPQQISPPPTIFKRLNRNNPARLLYRHSRKLTISLIFITISYFTLTFPSTVIFSFFRAYIEPPALRRTISLLFTNLSTTTHAIRFFIYFFCSTDFRKDFYNLFLRKRSSRRKSILTKEQSTIVRHTTRRMESESTINKKFLLECDETEKTRKE
ncbi:unnamed protein product [Rotaria magnacalcarata]|uniref:G-protein coupled receptors family 1 profile domain-containing protein n=1 Tax=Rotaria magnacalcarata TaxID=392030 RepID=A0A8S2L0S5_9BILA|nr:unnamed protein product [Rotaria magnacalcarata]